MDRGDWQSTVHVVTELDTREPRTLYFHFLEEKIHLAKSKDILKVSYPLYSPVPHFHLTLIISPSLPPSPPIHSLSVSFCLLLIRMLPNVKILVVQ